MSFKFKNKNKDKTIMILRIIFYPLVCLRELPIAWINSLGNSKVLLLGKWENYMGFLPKTAINNLFYKTQWLNINQYGRNGISKFLSLGNYPISNLFHISLISSYIFSRAGAATTLFSTIIWIFSNLIWLETNNIFWSLIIVFILALSSTSYAMAFSLQNYQILSWFWMPLALYHTNQAEYISSFFSWMAISLFGLTQIVWGVPLCIYFSFKQNSFFPILIIFICSIVSLLRIYPLLKKQNSKKRIMDILKLIGVQKSENKYSYNLQKMDLSNWYLITLYSIPIILFWMARSYPPILLIIGYSILICNQRFIRVADKQSVIILNATLIVFEAMSSSPNLFILLALFIAINPYGLILGIENMSNKIKVFSPFDHEDIFKNIEKFFSPIKENSKVYASFKDPKNNYHEIFNGYSVLHELSLSIANKNNFHLFPDWYAVAEYNSNDSPNLWSESIDDVFNQCKIFGAKYALIYRKEGSNLEKSCLNNFKVISEYDWSNTINKVHQNKTWGIPKEKYSPKWFLLEIKN